MGIQSGVNGRRQAVCNATVAAPSDGISRVAILIIRARASSVSDRSNPASSSVEPHQMRPSVLAYIELPPPISS